MAKKKPARRKPQANPVLARIQTGLKKMQRDGEAVMSRVRTEATRVSREQQRAVTALLAEAKRFRGDLNKLVKHASKDLESQSKRVLSALEKEAEKRIEPVVSRLVGSDTLRHEVQKLSERVRELENAVRQHSHPESRPADTEPHMASIV